MPEHQKSFLPLCLRDGKILKATKVLRNYVFSEKHIIHLKYISTQFICIITFPIYPKQTLLPHACPKDTTKKQHYFSSSGATSISKLKFFPDKSSLLN